MIADVPRVKLSELVGRFGTGLSRDARQCRALLADVCANQFRGECAVLVTAVEEGVAGELLSNSSGLPTEVLLVRLSDRLRANRGVSADLARWGVESWAVALGVVAGGNTLATFKMEGLVPLIDLAGADGTITDAELNHLILEAKTRGVCEADARAYLSAYAAARGWRLGKAIAAPQPPSPPSQPQPVHPQLPPSPQPAPDRAFRWVAAGVVALAAIAVILVVTRKEQPQLPQAQPATAPIPAPAPTPTPDAVKQQQADREQQTYNAARGNLSALQAYVNTCTVCVFAGDARSEISKLQTTDQEARTYNASRGNKYALQAYIKTCTVCAYESVARAEIAALDAAQIPATTPSPATAGGYQKTACGSIMDTKTGLQWYVGPDVYVSWTDAIQWTRQLSACGGGWSLPTVAQLKALFDQTVSAGTGFYTNGRYWPAHIDPIFSAIGSGSWVWAAGDIENTTAPAVNFNQGIGVRLSTSDTRYTVRAFAVKAAPPASSPSSAAYAKGASEWRAYKVWSDAQTGDRRAGVNYWASNRNVRDHFPCDEQAEEYSDNPAARTIFAAGCEDAKRWLDPIDARRADPQYRAGFNDEATRSPLSPP